jgi:hypothetical protein
MPTIYIDGSLGEVIFHSLQLTLGTKVYTNEVHKSWIRVFSRKLAIIVPIAVNLELNPGMLSIPPTTILVSILSIPDEYDTSTSSSRRESMSGCPSARQPITSNPSTPPTHGMSGQFAQCPFSKLDPPPVIAPVHTM